MRLALPACLLPVIAIAVVSVAHAGPVSITDPAVDYTQNFDTLPSSGTTFLFTGGTTLTGWYAFNTASLGNNPFAVVNVGNGSGNQVGAWDFGATGSSDRALGGIGVLNTTGASTRVTVALAMTNNTGADISAISLLYDSEQWRNGGTGQVFSRTLQYGYGGSFTSVASWIDAGAGFNASTTINSTTLSALDGNAAANRTADIGGTITTNWASGATLWVRWLDNGQINTGPASALAIDNVRVGFTPASVVPEPSAAALLLAGAGIVAGVARRRRPAR